MAKETSFTKLGLFSMATYPYSLKILWSPIVDSVFNKRIGRRRSWIIPVQTINGLLLCYLGYCIRNGIIFRGVDAAFHSASVDAASDIHKIDVASLAKYFGALVFLCATQDIAVDGWALTILSKNSVSFASTAQTFGLNFGYFLSFTVFLALNSADFANKHFRKVPLPYGFISLSGYLTFAGVIYLLVTSYVTFFTTEVPHESKSELPLSTQDQGKKADEPKVISMEFGQGGDGNISTWSSIKYIYYCFWRVLKLKSVRTLVFVHMVSKFAFQANEAATTLKLLEKGFKREDLSMTVLIDFPFEMIFGYYVVKWTADIDHAVQTSGKRSGSRKANFFTKFLVGESGTLTPWMWGFLGRICAALLGNYVVSAFPSSGVITKKYFAFVMLQHLLSSFMSTIQFVSVQAFHTKVADPILGGTYMTLLNTVSNFGGTWPRAPIMYIINYLTIQKCHTPQNGQNLVFKGSNPEICTVGLKGQATILHDGYYATNFLCVGVGLAFYFLFIKRKMNLLQSLPMKSWRCA